MIVITIDVDCLLTHTRTLMDVSCCLSVIGWGLAFAAWRILARQGRAA